MVDIPRLAAHAKAAWGSIVCVDNTFATPVNSLPLTLGADVVLHSASRVAGGCGGEGRKRSSSRAEFAPHADDGGRL